MLQPNGLQQLKDQYACDKGVLTIYLNTDQTSNDQQKGEWKIRLKNGLKKLEQYIERMNANQIQTFKKLKKNALKEIENLQLQLPKSFVLVASEKGGLYLKELRIQVENEFQWDKEPKFLQLENLQKRYPQEGILLIQKENIYMIETSLGEVNEETLYSLELESADWKPYEGNAARDRMASSANHRDKYDQRFEANQIRWLKQLASDLEQQGVKRGWKHVYLLGEKELVTEFEKQVKLINKTKINKNYTNLTSMEILNQLLVS
ncbi:VLRF1 family aeRF1-type release factor [Halalkalibacter krulwichiae]|uniref:Uncharacterized protein n=1 Tax=Halalkalibacter krulwichiae TaxID=199441 RepID=A0A1X9MA64_9BACI|nr:VLRF1 family aeRF1-type release factor [Halalkalibacter krulwichiae]ARK28481.1 hypothetical protein BkAM31D_00550 [Halalkalibacter krulwichiae]